MTDNRHFLMKKRSVQQWELQFAKSHLFPAPTRGVAGLGYAVVDAGVRGWSRIDVHHCAYRFDHQSFTDPKNILPTAILPAIYCCSKFQLHTNRVLRSTDYWAEIQWE